MITFDVPGWMVLALTIMWSLGVAGPLWEASLRYKIRKIEREIEELKQNAATTM